MSTAEVVSQPGQAIKVTDLAHVPNIVVPIQPGGTTIRGYCGAGKSLLLQAVGLGLGNKDRGRLEPEDGANRGEIDCLGVLVSVTESRVTTKGDLQAVSLESQFDLSDLIDPPLKDAAARNRHGIKALLQLTGAKADPALFYDLAGGKEQFERIVSADSVKTVDLVEMAGKIKRAFDARARLAEDEAEKEEGKAAALRHAGDGLDLSAETDAAKLQAAHVEAVSAQSALETKANAARQAREKATEARRKLAEATGHGQTVSERKAEEKAAGDAYEAAAEKVRQIKAQLAEAESVARERLTQLAAATQAREAAERFEAATAGWQSAIEAAEGVECPSDEQIEAAARATQAAQQAVELAGVVRDAKAKVQQATEHQEAAAEHHKRAMQLRNAAKDTDGVLSSAVASTRYYVSRERLMGVLPDGATAPYYAMSDGERTMIAVAEKIERARAIDPDPAKLVVIDVPQRTWQDIPDSVRDRLFGMAAEQNACIVTALVDDGKLRCVVWNPEHVSN